jgi:hypothetical protein
MPCGCHGRDVSHGHRFGTAHGRLALHHFFRNGSLRFISGKKDPTLPALRLPS